MKHQGMRDRMHEHEGMMHHKGHMGHGHMRAHGQYENEVEKPSLPHEGHLSDIGLHGSGLHEFKRECDPIAYGQASEEGCRADSKRLASQARDYHWD